MSKLNSNRLHLCGVALALFSQFLSGAEPDSNRVTRATSFEATNALAAFEVESGFRIELVAAEPLVNSPAAIAFDEKGQLFVAEMRVGSTFDGAKPNGRIRLLQDPDDQGQFKSSTIVADDVPWPSALACYAGGIFVASGADVLLLKDTTGDGIADARAAVLSGFSETNAPGATALVNNFNWSLPGRIFGASPGVGNLVTSTNYPESPVIIDRGDFSFQPRTLALVPESGPSQSGLTFDNFGKRYISEPTRPLRFVMYERRYWLGNPFFATAPELLDVATPATPVFAAPVQKSGSGNGSRTNMLLQTLLSHAQGVVVYRGNAFPTNYFGNAFVCDPETHGVHRFSLSENGLVIGATRPVNERNSEFLLSKESSFRPVQAVNGPDGALYVVDAQEANDHGRIYRVVPRSFKQPSSVNLKTARIFDLVSTLANPNGWHRDTAARLLFERQDPAAVPLLSGMLSNSVVGFARLTAAHTLGNMGALNEGHVLRLLEDKNASIRQQAILLSELLMPNGNVPPTLWSQFKSLVNDPSLRVRLQLAFTLGVARHQERTALLARLLARDAANEWIQTAVLSSLGEGAGTMFRLLAADNRFRNDPLGMAFLQRLADMIGARGKLDDANQVIAFLSRASLQPLEAFRLTAALGEGLRRTRSSLGLIDVNGALVNIYTTALALAIDATVAELVRVEALRLLVVSPYTYADTSDWLLLMCNPHGMTALRATAVEVLGVYDDPRIITGFLERWPGFPPLLRRQAVMSMLARNTRVQFVIAALKNGNLQKVDLPSNAMNLLRSYPDPNIGNAAKQLLGPLPIRRPELMDQFKSAVKLRGSANHGRDLFQARCSGCHQMSGPIRLLGPDLLGARAQSKEKLLSSILEPNAQISDGYETWVLESQEGELVIGTKTAESQSSVVMRKPGANPVAWPKLNIRSLRKESWSLMPDGVESGLSPQDMADLLEFLVSSK